MNNYNFNFEIQTLLTHFVSAINNIRIKRYDGEKFEKELIRVPITLSPKSQILQDLTNRADQVRLPIIALRKKSEIRATDRLRNKQEDIRYKNSHGQYVNLRAIPWDIDMEMSILVKYQQDSDQIIQHIATNFNSYINVSSKEPKSGREKRSKIIWDGNINYELPGDNQTPQDFPFRIIVTTSFKIEGWLYITNVENDVPICNINTDYIFTDKLFCNLETLEDYSIENYTDSYTLTGRPVLRYVSPYYFKVGDTPTINVQGYGFNSVHGLFISGSNDMFPTTAFNPSGTDIVFNGMMIEEFSKDNNNLTFKLPAASAIGFIDIIAVNSCGVGQLTHDANRCNRVENPYPVTDPEHYNWCVLQFPYLNGLIVSDNHNTMTIDYSKQIISVEEPDDLDRDALIEKIKELMLLGNIELDDLV